MEEEIEEFIQKDNIVKPLGSAHNEVFEKLQTLK
jgi:hypothetical protein